MSICWMCHWGWPAKVAAIYNKYWADTDLCFGIGHIVWSDENFLDVHINSCLEPTHIDDTRHWHGYSDEQLNRQISALRDLLTVPESERMDEPDDYDGEHPESFPPKNIDRVFIEHQ